MIIEHRVNIARCTHIFKIEGALMIKGKKITDGVLRVKTGEKDSHKEVGVVVSKHFLGAKGQ